MAVLPSPEADAIPLSIEPVIAWRAWGLAWGSSGGVVMCSPLLSEPWNWRVATKARCRSDYRRHEAPASGCMCGLYGVARLDRLPAATGRGAGYHVGVVGSVALWGTVVEHAAGFRGEYAYPSRLRLVCSRCFMRGWDGVPSVVQQVDGRPLPVCAHHALAGRDDPRGISPAELQQMLLDAYAVDLLPLQALHDAGYGHGHPPEARFVPAARSELRQLTRTWAGALAVVLLILAFLFLRASDPSVGPAPQPSPAPTAVLVDGEREDEAPRATDPSVPEPRDRSRFGLVCGTG